MLLKSQETMQKYHNKHHKKIEFQIDDVIWLRTEYQDSTTV
jgi:hypothetical protein